MFRLYPRKNVGSAAVALMDVPRNANKSIPNWFKAINPRGEVPTIVLPDNSLMTEHAAVIIYLADLYPQAGSAPTLSSSLLAGYLR
jgi:glutathione S-transferase